MRWKKANRKARVYATDYFFSDASLDLEAELIESAPKFSMEAAYEFLASLHWSCSVRVQQAPLQKGIVGYYDPDTSIVTLDTRCEYPDTVRWGTLCHELAHHYQCQIVGRRGPYHDQGFLKTLRMVVKRWHIWIDDFAA